MIFCPPSFLGDLPVSHNGIAHAWSAWSFGLPGSIPGAGVLFPKFQFFLLLIIFNIHFFDQL